MQAKSEIIYSGNYKITTDITKRYAGVGSKLSQAGACEVPALRAFSVEDAHKATDVSVNFPIECGMASDDLDFINFTPIYNAAELTSFAKKAQESGVAELVARKGAFKMSSLSTVGFMIMGSDFISFNRGDDLVVFGSDNSVLFEANGLDRDYVYRFGYNGENMFFDNMLHRSKVDIISKPSLENLDTEDLTKIQNSFAQGLQVGIFNAEISPSKGYNFSASVNNESTAYALGGMIGSEIKTILNTAFAGTGHKIPSSSSLTGEGTWRSVIVKLAAVYNIGNDSMRKKINAISAVHSAMMGIGKDADPAKAVEEAQSLIPTNERSSIQSYASDIYSVSNFLMRRGMTDSKFVNAIERSLEFPEVGDFSTESSITLTKSQVRILEEKAGSIQLRFQVWNLRYAEKITVAGEEVTEVDNLLGNQEWTIVLEKGTSVEPDFPTLEEWKSHFQALVHSEQSQAGTQVTYVPLDFTEAGFVSKETGKLIIPIHLVVSQCKNYSGETKSAISIVNEILEKIIK